jgi:hypothetical protein
MKSEKAKKYLTKVVAPIAMMYPDAPEMCDLKLGEAKHAVELAEQEAEERVRQKAIEAHRKVCFFRNFKDNTCANTATPCGQHSCYYMNYIVQKLTEL